MKDRLILHRHVFVMRLSRLGFSCILLIRRVARISEMRSTDCFKPTSGILLKADTCVLELPTGITTGC